MNSLYPLKLFVTPSQGTEVLTSVNGYLKTCKRTPEEQYPFSGKATIHYDPRLGKKYDPWWVIASCDNEIANYYRWHIERRFGITLLKPAFDAHVSIVIGEQPTNIELWGKHQNLEIDFSYTNKIYTNGEFWWLNVQSPAMLELRDQLGLPEKTHNLHLTIGRVNKTHMS